MRIRIQASARRASVVTAIALLLLGLVALLPRQAAAATVGKTEIALSLVCDTEFSMSSTRLYINVQATGYVSAGGEYSISATPNGPAPDVAEPVRTTVVGTNGVLFTGVIETATVWLPTQAHWSVTRVSDHKVMDSGVAPVVDCPSQWPPTYDCHLSTDFPTHIAISAPVMDYNVHLFGCTSATAVDYFYVLIQVAQANGSAVSGLGWTKYGGRGGGGREVLPWSFSSGPGTFHTVVDDLSAAADEDSSCYHPTMVGDPYYTCRTDWIFFLHSQTIVAKYASRAQLQVATQGSSIRLTAHVQSFDGQQFVSAKPGTTVFVQRLCSCGQWHTLTAVQVGADGTAVLDWGAVKGARYRVVTHDTATTWGTTSAVAS